ncbi:MAG: hypothetical protein N4A57_12420 [Anaeromicrobium sp.]|jgi:hypothetical protein|uniref:hypothetical protein n=1 Tax=Anaeromicrobium sp. TaxID=1929132 RepID=UPI0025DFDC33|nr:hypothetical protein [Anaeromicrobium sp.]MCT4595057.1 hypothetical protein [Anaeromicrobium sp.]
MIVKIHIPRDHEGIDILKTCITTTHKRIIRNYIDELEISEDKKEMICEKLRENKKGEKYSY